MKKGDLLPELTGTATDALGNVIDISGSTIKFLMTNCETDAIKINKTAAIVSGPDGTMKYVWNNTVTSDTDTAGRFRGEFEVTFPDTRKLTFPNTGYIPIQIDEDLA